ncbi:DNA polymerase epsilon subunit 3 [Sitophilus oryzae]|uniref:DNA polymerase epsilon subunit 3 n=1 Tax=Sitophilus oryzae TaxID=7048 RepID=A0A6J2XSF4_SITOR|nr:DNA polymerase epsilon subunit 3 [Sitophilus oryzae]
MAEKLEDLNLPGATVARIIKESLPDNVIIGKDARAALSRAASVFVLFLTSQASQEAQREKRKTLLGQDVIKALEELEFEDFIDPLQRVLKDFKESKGKKQPKSKKPNENGHEEVEEEQEDDIVDEETGD